MSPVDEHQGEKVIESRGRQTMREREREREREKRARVGKKRVMEEIETDRIGETG